MRICFLADASSIHTRRWIGHFAARGHEVHLLSYSSAETPGVREHRLTRRTGGKLDYLASIPEVRRIVRQIRPDLVHAHYVTSYGLLGALSGPYPLAVTAWGSDILVTPQESAIMRALVTWVLRRADVITSDSRTMSARIETMGGAGKTWTVPLGVGSDLLEEGEVARHPWQVASLRALERPYRVDVLIKAFRTVLDAHPEARLVIGNRGPELEALQRLVEELAMGEAVSFVGFQPSAELHRLLRESAIYVSIPESDATSVTLLEAMACGAYPVVSDLPANREWVEDGQNGSVVAGAIPEAVASSLLVALGQSEVQDRARALNREIIRQRALWEANMDQVEDLYRQITRA